MEDNTFRPERRPINVAELQQPTEKQGPAGLPPGVVSGKIPSFLARMEEMEEPEHSAPVRHIPDAGTRHAAAIGAKIDSRLSDLVETIRQTTNRYEAITLPSLGHFYDGSDGPEDGILHVRPMTGREEEILATQRWVKKGHAMNMIFSSCIKEKFDIDKLLIIDRTHLLIYLRGISYTPSYDVELKCPECDNKFPETIDLDTLDVNTCPDDFDKSSLSGTLPTTNLSYTFHLARGSDDKKVTEYQDHKKRLAKNFDTTDKSDDSMLYRLAVMLDNIADITETKDLLILLQNLPINDVSHLRNAINNPPFGVDTNIPIQCPNCPAEFDVDLPMESNFFFPRKAKTKKESN